MDPHEPYIDGKPSVNYAFTASLSAQPDYHVTREMLVQHLTPGNHQPTPFISFNEDKSILKKLALSKLNKGEDVQNLILLSINADQAEKLGAKMLSVKSWGNFEGDFHDGEYLFVGWVPVEAMKGYLIMEHSIGELL